MNSNFLIRVTILLRSITLIVALSSCVEMHAQDAAKDLTPAETMAQGFANSDLDPAHIGTMSSGLLSIAYDHPELAQLPDLIVSDRDGDLGRAESLCTELLNRKPTADVFLLRAAIRLDLEQPTAAHADVDVAQELGPRDWRIHLVRSQIFLAQGEWDLAEAESNLMENAWDANVFWEDAPRIEPWSDPGELLGAFLGRIALSRSMSLAVLAAVVFLIFWLFAFLRGRKQRRDAGGSWRRLIAVSAVVALLWTLPVTTFSTLEFLDIGRPPSLVWHYVLLLLSALMAFLMMSPPNITYVGKEPLPLCDDPELVDRIRHLAEALHVRVPRVRVQTAVNSVKDGVAAFVGGLAPFSIVVYDTVLQQLRTDEQDAVIGHELAHVANRSIRLYVALFPLAACCGVVISFFTNGYLGFISAIALRSGVFRIVSRRFEYDSDRRSALVTSPDAMARGLRRIHAGHALGRPTLMASLALSCSTHPSLDERVAALAKLNVESGMVTVPFDERRVRLCQRLALGFGFGWLLLVPLSIGHMLLTGNERVALPSLHLAILTPLILLIIALRRTARIDHRRVHGRWRWSKLTRKQKTGWTAAAVLVGSVLLGQIVILARFQEVEGCETWTAILLMLLSLCFVASLLVLIGIPMSSRINRGKVPKLMIEISGALQRGDYGGVVKIASDNYKVIATDRFLTHNAAVSLLAIGRCEKAVELLEKLHRDYPWMPVTATTLARVYLDSGNNQRAIEIVDYIQPELDRQDPLPLILKCRAFRGLDRTDEALTIAQQALTIAPDDTAIHALLAMLALDRGDRAEADRQIELGESLLPAEPLLRLARAERAVLDENVEALSEEVRELQRTISHQPLLLLNRTVAVVAEQLARLSGDNGSLPVDDAECCPA
ncbi:M48 family metalloprotease [bacterium]|nr:M48 family metalloprotease [bacterium]